MHARLRRELDASCGERCVGLLDEVELRRNLREEPGDLLAREIEEAQPRCRAFSVTSAISSSLDRCALVYQKRAGVERVLSVS